eukprot:gnl/TRDRNA2_/TRDRNA2_181917_c0_seq1.p1 gnl/TRDRNA2_/TRDRNA2_181917_c0~~gnl/TRDRNA2_/TRDRNA2_181917_c0_seq1.p1  ORF type:complete len:158 (+),score=38.31 gnl/TRDRNA2_/TRDRNA2_181917_c0_seq1:65-538(+)
MALRLGRRLLCAGKIENFAAYEAMKTSKTPMMVGWFTASHSTAGKMYSEQFEAMAKAYPRYSFFQCDVDDVPLAAYDAEVEHVPSVVILPLGLKPDGAPYDKTDMVVVAPELTKYNEVIARAKTELDKITVIDDPDEGERKPWQFDPATGATMPPHK